MILPPQVLIGFRQLENNLAFSHHWISVNERIFLWLNSSLVREAQQVVVAAAVRDVKEDRSPEVEHL